jgi:hypothetical protein
MGILAGLVVYQGRSARKNARLAGGAYELALRLSGLKARAMADGREYVVVVADALDPAACEYQDTACGRIVVLRNPVWGAFAVAGFAPDAPVANAEVHQDDGARSLPVNSQFDLGSTWRAPVPFDAVTAFDPNILLTCADGRRCFALRFRPDGEVWPVTTATARPLGFAFVLRQVRADSAAADRRALFISFPAGIVRTAAF